MWPCEKEEMKVFQLIIPKLFRFLSFLHHSYSVKFMLSVQNKGDR